MTTALETTVTARLCVHCAGPMPATARSHAKYCDGTCRVAALRERRRVAKLEPVATPPEPASPALPSALTRQARWVRRSATKRPLTASGTPARSNDPSTWTTYENATASTAGDGLGFVLNGDGIICVDIDHCLTDGVLSADAEAFLATLPATYIEISPSGTGLHVWGRGMVLTARRFRHTPMQGEVIGSRKYATVTGRAFRDAPPVLANISRQTSPLIF